MGSRSPASADDRSQVQVSPPGAQKAPPPCKNCQASQGEGVDRVGRDGDGFVELVGEWAVVAGFGDVVPRRRIRGEEGLAGAMPVVEEFTQQRIGEAEGEGEG